MNDLLTPEQVDYFVNHSKVEVKEYDKYIYIYIGGEYSKGDYFLQGYCYFYKDEDKKISFDIFSGFAHNPIGRVEETYSFRSRPKSVETILSAIVSRLIEARQSSIRADKAYIDYVNKTGDLS